MDYIICCKYTNGEDTLWKEVADSNNYEYLKDLLVEYRNSFKDREFKIFSAIKLDK